MILFLDLWITIVLAGIKYRGGEENLALSKNVIALRSIYARKIILGYIGIATESIVIYPNRKAATNEEIDRLV